MSAIVAPTSDAAPCDQPIDLLASRSLWARDTHLVPRVLSRSTLPCLTAATAAVSAVAACGVDLGVPHDRHPTSRRTARRSAARSAEGAAVNSGHQLNSLLYACRSGDGHGSHLFGSPLLTASLTPGSWSGSSASRPAANDRGFLEWLYSACAGRRC